MPFAAGMRYAEYIQVVAYDDVMHARNIRKLSRPESEQMCNTRTEVANENNKFAFVLGAMDLAQDVTRMRNVGSACEGDPSLLVRPSQSETPRPRAHADMSFGGLGVFYFLTQNSPLKPLHQF